jgi:Putative metal-binding motif
MNLRTIAFFCTTVLVGCGRSELDFPEDVLERDIPLEPVEPDIPTPRDTPDVPDRPLFCTGDLQCSDSNVCNGTERCVAGSCVSSAPLSCDDGIDCTADTCDPRGGCRSVPDNLRCDDGLFCNGAERCTPGRGCTRGTVVFCDDGNPCTLDSCSEGSRSCVRAPVDRDGDGFPDGRCGGSDCDDSNRNVNPGVREVCGDGVDNNCDGFADCRDAVCARTPACGVCMVTGPEGMFCSDGRDNDCNGLIDCSDRACAASPACSMCVPTGTERERVACTDGRDNDCNGLIDCRDPQCATVPECVMCVPTGPEQCRDGRDNDCNGSTDCADRACAGTDVCVVVPNDVCEMATVLSVPGRVSGDTSRARNDYAPSCTPDSTAQDVAFVIRNPIRQTLVINTRGSAFDTVLHVFRDRCAGMSLACNDDIPGGGLDSELILSNAEPGVYFIVVDGFGASFGAFTLSVSTGMPEQCSNGIDDDLDGAIDCMDRDCDMDPRCGMCVLTAVQRARMDATTIATEQPTATIPRVHLSLSAADPPDLKPPWMPVATVSTTTVTEPSIVSTVIAAHNWCAADRLFPLNRTCFASMVQTMTVTESQIAWTRTVLQHPCVVGLQPQKVRLPRVLTDVTTTATVRSIVRILVALVSVCAAEPQDLKMMQ